MIKHATKTNPAEPIPLNDIFFMIKKLKKVIKNININFTQANNKFNPTTSHDCGIQTIRCSCSIHSALQRSLASNRNILAETIDNVNQSQLHNRPKIEVLKKVLTDNKKKSFLNNKFLQGVQIKPLLVSSR